MKKLLILLILLFALPAYAQQCSEESPCPELARLSPAMMGSVPVAAGEAIEFVGSNSSNNGTCTLAVTAGNTVVVTVEVYGNNIVQNAVLSEPSTGKLGAAPTRHIYACRVADDPTWGGAQLWSASVTSSGDMTLALSLASIYTITISEFSGVGSFDKADHTEGGTTTSGNAPSITPTNDNSLIVACLGSNENLGASVTGDVAMTEIDDECPANGACMPLHTQYIVQTSKAAFQADWSWTNSSAVAMIVAVFAP